MLGAIALAAIAVTVSWRLSSRSQIFAVDVADGSVAWEQTALDPYSDVFGEWYVLGDDEGPAVLVTVDRQLDQIPASVRAIDIATGQLAWQRFLDVEVVFRSAQSDTELVVAGGSFNEFEDNVMLAVDARGELAATPPVQFDPDLVVASGQPMCGW